MPTHVACFDTPLGTFGLAWTADGIVGVQLPDADAGRLRAALRRQFPGAEESIPSPRIHEALQAMVALLSGEPSDLREVHLDMRAVEPFERQVYAIARTIPFG